MRVGLQGWGSEGDVRPLIALAARLRSEGHAPRLVLSPVDGTDYAPICRAPGIPLKLVPERMGVTVETLARDAKSASPMKVLQAVLDMTFYPYVEAMYDAASELCTTCDVVVGGTSMWPVKAAALVAGVPFVAIHYYPGFVPSRSVPPPGFPPWGWLNRPAWGLVTILLDLAFRSAAAEFFEQKGLPRVRHAIPDALFSDRLNLLAVSPAFWPPASDWGDLHRVCGNFVMAEANEAWVPSAELEGFLLDGPPPVLMSLGSMEHMAPERARDLLVAAARVARVRTIVQTKRDGGAEGRDGDLYFLPWAPHAPLAVRCSAVVHHGGAGTTHAALRAGRPSVVVPFIVEQRLWARQLRAVGAAAKPISFWKATPDRVAEAIHEVLASESLREAALRLAAAMAREDGTGAATRLIEGAAAIRG
jgi:sterol 3beta-glucosyltransferase